MLKQTPKNPFTERYKSFTNSELFRVIKNQAHYQPEAIEVAKDEIKRRNLTDQEVTAAKSELEAEQQEKQKQNEKRIEIEGKVKMLGISIFDTINPIQRSSPTAEKLIRLITIVYGLIALFKWYNQFGFVQFMFTDNTTEWDLSMFEYIIPLVILPVATILFGLRKKIGWTLLAAYLTYSVLSALGLLIMTWNLEPAGLPALDNLFPQASPTSHFMTTLFLGGTLWVLTKKEIKEHFKINRKTAIGTIAVSGILTILFIAPFFLT